VGRRYLVTGGAGFIGSNFIRWILDREDDALVTNLDALTYAGVPATVAKLDEYPGHTFVKGDIRDAGLLAEVVPGHDIVVNFAAESHVDRSITGPKAFLDTNVVGTGTVIEAAYRAEVPRFVHISTDEVYGSVPIGFAAEDAVLDPTSPYACSKAGSDLLVRAYHSTYGYDTVITRCTNNYGPYQYPEKLIPLFLTNLMEGRSVPLYGTGTNQRDWLYVEDHCAAVGLVADIGTSGEIYNVGANAQLSNLELTRAILEAMGQDESFIEFVEDRLGHDQRYAVDSDKLRGLGWEPKHSFADGISATIEWYKDNEAWWRPLKDAP
jgi:dTDP-glucose 4,6-dehydratase